jgi:hypothetical protein
MLRQWVESTVTGIRERLDKATERSGFSTTVKNNWIEFLYVAGIIALSAGIVSALVSPTPEQYIIYPGRSGQSISETIFYAMAMVLGFGGLYFSFLSGRQTIKPRLVGFFLILGLILIAVAIYLEMYIYFAK